jgi:hypothetical protein
VAHSGELVHPIVATTFPADLESPPELGSGQGPPPDPSRERPQPLREPRCFPLIGSLAGELIPQDRLTHNRLSDGAKHAFSLAPRTRIDVQILDNHRRFAPFGLGSNQLEKHAPRRP